VVVNNRAAISMWETFKVGPEYPLFHTKSGLVELTWACMSASRPIMCLMYYDSVWCKPLFISLCVVMRGGALDI
jgi:hypothetical protein